MLDQSFTDDVDKVPVQICIDEKDQNLGYAVPVLVDMDKTVQSLSVLSRHQCTKEKHSIPWEGCRNHMRRNPDAKDRNIDAGNEYSGGPFQSHCRTLSLREDCNSINDDL